MQYLGCMAEYSVVPSISVVKIDKDLPFEQAALVGCGVMTGVGAAIKTARVTPGSSVAVFGCGGVGLSTIQGARLAGARTIIAVDLNEDKLALAKEFGATHTINAGEGDPVDRIKELTGGFGTHYAFEAIGLVDAPFLQSIRCTRSRGITVWVGHAPFGTPVTMDARDLIMEKTVIGSMYGTAEPQIEFPRLLALYQAGKLKLDELITGRYRFDEINTAMDNVRAGVGLRNVILFGDQG